MLLHDYRSESGGSPASGRLPAPYLPPAPALDREVLRSVRREISGVGVVEGWVPSHYPRREMAEHAPAVICVPGLGMCAKSFIRQLPLARYCELHCLQYPAYAMPGEAGLGHFAAYLETYIRAHDLENRPGGVVLLGTSMGGAVSMLTAIRKRVRLRGLMLVGTFASRRKLSFLQRNLWPLSWIMNRSLMLSIARHKLTETTIFGDFDPHEAEYMLRCLNYHSNASLYRAAYGLTNLELLDRIREIDVPTLVLHGTHDYVLPHAAGIEISQTIPNAEFVSIDNGGHALFFVEHEPTNEALARFLIQRAVQTQLAAQSREVVAA